MHHSPRIFATAALGLSLSLSAAAARAEPPAGLRAGPLSLHYDLQAGEATLTGPGGAYLKGFSSAVRLAGRTVSSRDYPGRRASREGDTLTVTLRGAGLPTMVQRFRVETGPFITVRVEVSGKALRSRWMAPVVAEGRGCVHVGAEGALRALRVPFDNDKWARYDASPVYGPGQSHEASAFYEAAGRRALIVGSVTHDTWKTGVTFDGADGRVDALSVFGGAADSQTRDVEPHGAVSGDRLRSPEVMLGFAADWRDGMEAFARANAARAPMLPWKAGVPFGWNSWGKVQSRLNAETAAQTVDFFAGTMAPRGFRSDGVVYINLDSYWDNLSDDNLRRFVRQAHARKARAGIYWAPFAYWGKDLSRTVEGSRAAYAEAVLRTSRGEPISLDGAYALDPTHPAARGRMDHFIGRFRRAGFDDIKLDFLTHGALEGGARDGAHWDRSVQTGIQAYNSGMRYLLKRIGDRMFISAAISPLFPHGYAHARRVSCDTYGGIGETEYLLNSAGYGWWLSGILYRYNDPDHIVLEGFSNAENGSRVTSAAIAGTVFLSGDDVTRAEGRERVERWLTNKAVNGVARRGIAFRPVEGDSGRNAPDLFVSRDGAAWYLAVFNFDGQAAARRTLDLARAGLDPSVRYRVTDLWSGRAWDAGEAPALDLEPAGCRLLRFEPRGGLPPDKPPGVRDREEGRPIPRP